jgi:D-3-phosphoglycerate dehydrogenase
MSISILDVCHDTTRTLACFKKLKGYNVETWNDHLENVVAQAHRSRETEALVLIRERTKIFAPRSPR